jgi:hypothetical protein
MGVAQEAGGLRVALEELRVMEEALASLGVRGPEARNRIARPALRPRGPASCATGRGPVPRRQVATTRRARRALMQELLVRALETHASVVPAKKASSTSALPRRMGISFSSEWVPA